MTPKLENILCVDDDPTVLAVAKICLETLGGYSVMTKYTGQDGVAAALTYKPDFILLDVVMPDMDGPATLKVLRDHAELDYVPIVFLTSRVRLTEIEEYLVDGVDGVIPKPFDPTTFGARVREIWDDFHSKRAQVKDI